jgi:acyl carrier protein
MSKKTKVPAPKTRDEIESWMIARVAEMLDVDRVEIDPTRSFSELGLDSRSAVRLSGELEEALGLVLPASIAWDFPTISELSEALVDGRAVASADKVPDAALVGED